jgi:hypothetical protein
MRVRSFRTHAADYAGRRHARLTRSMKRLDPALQKILVELRYRIRDGERRSISNAVLAEATGYSEGFVSAAVRWLAGEAVSYFRATRIAPSQPFIARESLGPGQGYLTTMLPPPELRGRGEAPAPAPVAAFSAPKGDHQDDPLPAEADSASQCTEVPQQGDHPSDPSILMSPDMPPQHGVCPADEELPPVVPGSNWPLPWQQIRQANPGYTHAAFFADLRKAESRKGINITDPLAVVVSAKLRGEPVYSLEELHARSAAGAAGARQGPQPDLARRPGRCRGAAAPPRVPVAQPPPSFASLEDLGPGFTLDELLSMSGLGPHAHHTSGRGG